MTRRAPLTLMATLTAILMTILATLTALLWGSAQAQPAAGRALPVEVVAARLGKLSVPRETTVVIGPEQEATVVAPTSGTVLAVLKRRDTPVAAGEAVVQLDALALTQAVQDAQFALSSAQVSLGSASATSPGSAIAHK